MLVVISVAVLMSRESEPIDMQLTVEFTYSRDMPDAQVACDSVKHPNQELVYCEIDQGDGVAMMTMALFDVTTLPPVTVRHIGISHTPITGIDDYGTIVACADGDRNKCSTDYGTYAEFLELTLTEITLWMEDMGN